MASLWFIALGGLIGFLSAVFAVPIRDWLYRPKLELSFSGEADCISETSETRQRGPGSDDFEAWPAIYLRVRVTNKKKSIAKSCSAYLVGIERDDGQGNFEPTIYVDSIPLAWSCRGELRYSEIDIPHGVSQYIDVLSTSERANRVIPQWQFDMIRYLSLFNQKGRYRLSVLVSGDGLDPATIKLIFVWKGQWDTFEACPA